MKVRSLDITTELLVEFSKTCKAGPPRRFIVKENPLPDDARIVRMRQLNDYTLRLYITSESFTDVAGPILQLPPVVFETIYDDTNA